MTDDRIFKLETGRHLGGIRTTACPNNQKLTIAALKLHQEMKDPAFIFICLKDLPDRQALKAIGGAGVFPERGILIGRDGGIHTAQFLITAAV